jgi:acyl-CoA synthetase (AMP-forming)/AMP-acid ligase II
VTGNDRIMTVLPFHYCFGTSLLHTHLRVGGSLVVDSRFMYPETILQRMIEAECPGFAGAPSHFQVLLRNSSLKKKQFPHLRYVQQAGGHLAPFFIRELQEALPTTQVFIMCGQTEATARLSYLDPEALDSKLGSIGKGIPGVTLRVLDESGQEVQTGKVGEIVAEGENVALGYWHAPQESTTSFRDGKLYTGDMATVDEDGFIYVVDRAKDFVKWGGSASVAGR